MGGRVRKGMISLGWVLAIAGGLPAQGVGQDTVTVKVTGIRNTQGIVRVALWNGPEGFPKDKDKAWRLQLVPASTEQDGKVTASFKDVPSGDYAVSVVHDENGNGKLDKNVLGIPKEGWGVSNGFYSKVQAPTFDGVKVKVDQPEVVVPVTVRY